jgi:gamma-glutamyltranspeptidase
VAAAAALAVIDPYMAGLGGFGYLLAYDARGDRVFGIDFIGTAPRSARIELYTCEDPWEDYKPTAEGMMAALVPGNVAGWAELLERLGSMTMKQVLGPALKLARGFPVTRPLHQFYEAIKPFAARNESTARVFYAGGAYPEPGQVLSQPQLARTLELLAERGPREFYEGAIAKRIARHARAEGGIITEEDLARYRALPTEPLSTLYRGTLVYSHRPGSSGMTVLQWLNILERFKLAAPWHSDANLHVFLEAGKLALRDDDRWNSGKEYARPPLSRLLSKAYARAQASKIGRRARFYPLVRCVAKSGNDTTHLCASDAQGNIVSMTMTQMYGFDRVGLLGDLGFSLNGGMCYFSLDPGHIERLEPCQRPRYVMSPTIAFSGEARIALGAAGGWTIPQTITLTLLKMLDFRMGAQEAVSSPRLVLRYRYNSIPYAPGTVVDVEERMPEEAVRGLARRGHVIGRRPMIQDPRPGYGISFGAVNALLISGERIEGGAEVRRDGFAALA